MGNHGAGDGNRTHVRSLGSSYSAIELRPQGIGGERGIRTPDTLAGMHDFESCAFNQALPSLQKTLDIIPYIEPLCQGGILKYVCLLHL